MRWQPMRRERRNRFAKPGAPPTWTSAHPSFSSSFSSRSFLLSFLLLPLLPVAASTARPRPRPRPQRHDRMNRMPSSVAVLVPALPPLLPSRIYVFPCNVHLPRSGEREITRSFFPYFHSCQLMSYQVQRLHGYLSRYRCSLLLASSLSLPTFVLYESPFTEAD